MLERTAGKSDYRALFGLYAEISVLELCLPVEAMRDRLAGRAARLLEQGKGCLQREREKCVCGNFLGCEKAVGERAFGSGEAAGYSLASMLAAHA